MKVINFSQVVSQLKFHLVDYLSINDINVTKGAKITCLFPDHDEQDPSMSVDSTGTFFKCFGCGRSGDIFTAAHLLEGKPLSGPMFIQDNLAYLAKMYGIDLAFGTMTDEEKRTYRLYKLYADAANIVASSSLSDIVQTELKNRNWDVKQARKLGVGSVESFSDFIQQLKDFSWSQEDIVDAGLDKISVFSPTRLIFTIYDQYGQPVSFSSRNLRYDTDNKREPKYDSIRTIDGWTYKKGNSLYGVNWAQETIKKNPGANINIVEGHPDVISMKLNGIPAVAIQGGMLSIEQVHQLENVGVRKVTLCFDGDPAGIEKTERAIDDHFSTSSLLSVKIACLSDGMDPDSLLRTDTGKMTFRKMFLISPFEWVLNREMNKDTYDPNAEDSAFDLCDSVIPSIASEPDPLVRGRYVHTLSQKTGVEIIWITQKVNQIVHLNELEKLERKERAVREVRDELVRDPNNAVEIANRLIKTITEIDEEDAEERFGADECARALLELKDLEDNKGDGYDGFLMSGFPKIQELLSGDWSTAFTLVGGRPNAGKTSFLCQLGLDIALSNDGVKLDPFGEASKETIVVIHSIDDAREKIFNRLLTQLIRWDFPSVSMNMVKNPWHWVRKRNIDPIFITYRDQAYAFLTQLIKDNRLYVKDASNGATLSYLDMNLSKLREKHPNKRLFYVFDNLSKVRGTGKKDERSIAKAASEAVKDMSTKYKTSLVCTVEYRKGSDKPGRDKRSMRPKDDDIAETIQFQYDADQIIHMHCDLKVAKETSPMWWKRNSDGHEVDIKTPEGIIEPVNELIFTKSKITDSERTIFLDFIRSQAYFREAQDHYVFQRKRQVKELLGSMPIEEQNGMAMYYGPGGVPYFPDQTKSDIPF